MKLTDVDLVLYADRMLSEDRQKELQEAARHDAELANTLAALDASRQLFKTAFAQQDLPPVPAVLRADIKNLVQKTQSTHTDRPASDSPAEPRNTSVQIETSGHSATSVQKSQVMQSDNVTAIQSERNPVGIFPSLQGWPKHAAQAACLMLCVGGGFLIGANTGKPASSIDKVAGVTQAEQSTERNLQLAWVERVADYQTLYVPNTVEHIETDLPSALSKLDKMAAASGMQAAVPDLSKSGYRFARVQELGYEGQTLIQLVYSKPGHTPLALCFMPANGAGNLALQIGKRHGLGTASWINNNQRFVIVANESPESLTELYDTAKNLFVRG